MCPDWPETLTVMPTQSAVESRHSVAWRLAFSLRAHLAICAAVTLTGCGASSGTSGGDGGSTLAPTVPPTADPTPTVEPPSPSPSVLIACAVASELCSCSDGARCGNESVVPGVKNRGDAGSCCCPSDAPLIWDDQDAKCMESSKCTWGCCGSGQKLCGDACCAPDEKCLGGTCQQTFALSTAAPEGLLTLI